MAEQSPSRSPGKPLGDLPIAALTAIGAGIGGIGFFTFVGAGVTLARFRGAGISGTDGVAHVPKADLLAIGVDILLLPTLIGLLVVSGIALTKAFRAQSRRRRRLVGLGLIGVAYFCWRLNTWWSIGDWNGQVWQSVVALAAVAIFGGWMVDALARGAGERGTYERAGPGALLFLVVAVFVAVGSYALAYAHPIVHAGAVLRSEGRPGVWGIYIGETDGRVWLAETQQDPDDPNRGQHVGRIIGFPTSEVTDISIGRSTRLSSAMKTDGPCLLDELRRRAGPVAGKPPGGCPKLQ